jgi:hypothetical protein
VHIARQLLASALGILVSAGVLAAQDTTRRVRPDTARGAPIDSTRPSTPARVGLPLPLPGDLGLDFRVRIETKAERTRNERCTASQLFSPLNACRGGLQPDFNFQFALKSSGTVADRFHVNVDYDTQREFDASNNLSVWYEGQKGELVQRVELGNVSFAPPPSRFITSNVPSGNYGFQAIAQVGPFRLRTIAAQQKGNVVQSRTFIIGDRTVQPTDRDVEDYQIEPRRFFFTVDPTLFAGYPNIDILDRTQLARLRASLPDTLRPTRVLVYRVQFGTQPQNPNGPRFRVQGGTATTSAGRQTYDVLREGVDYSMDPSLLWFALVRPLNPSNERLVVAYNVRLAGSTRDTVFVTTGGTPDLGNTGADQVANLIWDPSLSPNAAAFRREIRSVYRVAGPELQRQTTRVRVVTGAGDQEKPLVGTFNGRVFDTYLQMLGLAQANNGAEFDYENRLWPRPGDPVFNLGAGAGSIGIAAAAPSLGAQAGIASPDRILQDYFIVFPSLRPFATRDSGLIVPGNPAGDTIYRTPGEYLYSQQHPPSNYRIRLHYEAEGSDATGAVSLGAVQLRPGSERVEVNGRILIRDVDYRLDYDLGRLTFVRPDTLFPQARRVSVRYEESPLFAPAPTSLYGLVSELPLRNGQIAFTALTQSQKTTFIRPQLGFEPVSTVLAGVSGQYQWQAPALTRLMSHMPFGETKTASRFAIQGEVAASRPQPNSIGSAYVESFEGEGGISLRMDEPSWYFSSLPAYGHTLRARFGASAFRWQNASTLAWQNNPRDSAGHVVTFSVNQIDPLANVAGIDAAAPEQILWLTLYPLGIGGRLNEGQHRFDWLTSQQPAPGTRRFRSIRTVLSPVGVDLTRVEYIEFWTLIDTASALRSRNPTLIFDFGDVSENSLTFGPDTLIIARSGAGVDSTFRGKKLQGVDSLDTERDPLSRGFNVDANDTGLAGDVVDTMTVIDGASVRRELRVPLCFSGDRSPQLLGDTRQNCTRGNSRLDEEDIDLDNALNLDTLHREDERILRFVVDLSDTARFTRVGGEAEVADTIGGIVDLHHRKQWVLVRVPFSSPDDSLNQVERRKMRALRLTMMSGVGSRDNELISLPLDRLRIVGAPWIKRSEQTIAGIAGDERAGGYVATSVIGTADRDTSRGIDYESPPGLEDQLDARAGQIQTSAVQINEKSLRIVAVGLPQYGRAESFFRFPSGDQNFMGYQELRVWGRGRNRGWGQDGELQMFVKVGRDGDNFYAFRTPVNSGPGRNTWLPEIRIQFQKFFELRQRIEDVYLRGGRDSVQCTGVDSALVMSSALPPAGRARFAACQDGYIVYTLEPGVTPPNLAAVQELSVGIVRIKPPGTGPTSTLPGDTLELWVDDIRLTNVVNHAGFAGQVAMELVAADVAELRVTASRRDPNFRQLGQNPTFTDERALDIQGTLHLERFLPKGFGFAMPLTVTHTRSASDPQFLSGSDLPGAGIVGLRTPRTDFTTYTLSLRRSKPIGTPVLAQLINHLSATTTYVDGGARNEFSSSASRRLDATIDYIVADSARTFQLPGWMDRVLGILPDWLQGGPVGALRKGVFRWNPTQIHLSTGFTGARDAQNSFLKPAGATDDDPRLSRALTDLWRSSGTVELQPTKGLTIRSDLISVRDMRLYGDSNRAGAIASLDRGALFGMDAGFERQRSMFTSVSFAPLVSPWLRPRADFGTTYSMVRDPNTSYLVAAPGSTDSTLPRRLTGSQSLGGGLTVDLPRAFAIYAGDSARWLRRFGRTFAPLDVTVSRSLISSLDGAPLDPSATYQFGIGGVGIYRYVGGLPATTVGSTESVNASSSLFLPFSTAIVGRYRRAFTRNWTDRPEQGQAQIQGAQTVFPDVSVRWNWRPRSVDAFITALSANLGYSDAAGSITIPGLSLEDPAQLRRSHVRAYPLSGSLLFAGSAGLNATTGFTRTTRIDSLPGSVSQGKTDDLNVDVGRSFRLPLSWGVGLKSDIRTHVGFQRSRTTTYILDAGSTSVSRLADQGRTSVNFDANADLTSNMLFTFQLSRVLTYDNNANRRVSQFVLSTVLQLQLAR